MKMKHFIYRILLTALLTAGIQPLGGDASALAQGIYSNQSNSENGEEDGNDSNRSGLFRAGGTENPNDGGQATRVLPVNDGWEVVVITGIGYGFCIAWRRRRRQNKALS
ncbi:MAG: hypothetical protein LBP83_08150 [Dysgonamonadaceae bacterium]|jgi:hypothetical protein|nr:hypothetical protein [Dysgonamonadaceae bacterium]